jgi:hypothetical protein
VKTQLARQNREKGAALLLSLFALLLLSAIGVFMYFSSATETHIDSNYRSGVSAFYSARLGVEEVRDRVRYLSGAAPGGLADLLPKVTAGNPGGVLYILNNSVSGVDPANPGGPFFDDQLCHDYNSGADKYTRCTAVPTTNGWMLPSQQSRAAPELAASFRWARINMKTNRIADPYFVNGANGPFTLDVPICFDGVTEQISPGGANPSCDANGMQNVYMVTSLAVTSGVSRNSSRRMLRSEVVPPSIRPAGAVTMDAANAAPSLGSGIPTTIVDGRNHNLDGTWPPVVTRCSNISALALDNDNARTALQAGLLSVRQSIVNQANTSCNYTNGAGMNGNNCTPALWWVRGTNQAPRFGSITVSSSGSGDHHDGGSGSGDGGSSGGSGSSITLTGADPSTLNLASPELMATSAVYAPNIPGVVYPASQTAPFTGAAGNQADPALYQPPSSSVLPDAFTTVRALVTSAAQQSNYISIPAGGALNTSYGSSTSPVILVINDSNGLTLQGTSLTGYGVLVIPNSLQLSSATLNWAGIVLVQGDSAQFSIGQFASGSVTGAVLLQAKDPTKSVSLITSSPNSSFAINYSCDAVDMAFGALPFKVISSSEFN